jgi:transposase-like protein
MSSPREDRGLEIAKSNVISENADGSFSVPSQSVGEIVYLVRIVNTKYECNCPDYAQRHEEVGDCKHIIGVKLWIAARVELREEPKPKVFSEDAVQCPKCGSIRGVKFGNYNGKQLYKCKDCRTKFREGLIKKAHYSPETITLTLDLYFSGLSVRKITRTLNDHFDMSLGKSTVYHWIETFVPRISEYVNSLTPQLSETWHADEVFVKMKGGERTARGDQENIAYLWNVMDRKTRFLLASRLSEKRDEIAALAAFNRAVRVAHGSEPEMVFTDALRAYNLPLSKAFSQKPKHIARSGIRKPDANNNRIERLNQTIRERTKVQRGWKTFTTPLAEGQRIHYNFVKPHTALEGQTPAERAGIGIDGRNKWFTLLQRAIRSRAREN